MEAPKPRPSAWDRQIRRKAGTRVTVDIAAGRLHAPNLVPCEQGDESCKGPHEWHHDSYLPCEWLNVRCLCKSHHARWHYRNTPYTPPEGSVEIEGRHRNRGAGNPSAKLTPEQAIAVAHAPGTHVQIAERFGISRGTVGNIKRGEKWSHVTGLGT